MLKKMDNRPSWTGCSPLKRPLGQAGPLADEASVDAVDRFLELQNDKKPT
jgi:hypothetical protein